MLQRISAEIIVSVGINQPFGTADKFWDFILLLKRKGRKSLRMNSVTEFQTHVTKLDIPVTKLIELRYGIVRYILQNVLRI